MRYLIFNKYKRFIKQFHTYDDAYNWCLTEKNKQLVYMVGIDMDSFKIKEVITF